ncbi:hypothetical protein AB0D24_26165 [Streptomyces javensis]|uniref:hypothetical protein n=1 Tax=Streptomyces javensis TaxID=114698 RepID=UPI0033F1240F
MHISAVRLPTGAVRRSVRCPSGTTPPADGQLTDNAEASLVRSFTGFGLAVAIGVPLGLLIGRYRLVADLLAGSAPGASRCGADPTKGPSGPHRPARQLPPPITS